MVVVKHRDWGGNIRTQYCMTYDQIQLYLKNEETIFKNDIVQLKERVFLDQAVYRYTRKLSFDFDIIDAVKFWRILSFWLIYTCIIFKTPGG